MNITYKSIAEKESGKTFPLFQRVISPRWLTAGSLPPRALVSVKNLHALGYRVKFRYYGTL